MDFPSKEAKLFIYPYKKITIVILMFYWQIYLQICYLNESLI